MVQVNVSIPDFSGGEISPNLYGRHDLAVYYNGARRVENFIVDTVGPAKFRTGSVFAAITADNQPAFMYPFEYTDGFAFNLEFTENKIRFYRNDGLVYDGPDPVEVTTTYAEADLFQLKFAQQNKDLYITHPSYNPKKLTFTDPVTWGFANHSPTGLTLSANNYPSAVGFYEQRLVYAGSNNSPNTLWFSKSANFGDFTIGTAVDDGIAYTIAGPANKISWLRGTDKFLAVGAQGDVYQVTGGIDNVITPSSISIRPSNSYGSANINPIGRGSQIFFMQNNNLVLRSFEYVFEQDSYVPADRNTVADHITKTGVTQMAFQEGRPTILWCVKNNGELIGMTVEELESVSGWHRHNTDGEIISVSSISRINQYDQIWICVKRTIDGSTQYSVEYLSEYVDFPDIRNFYTGDREGDYARYQNVLFEAQKQYIHLDCSSSYYGDLVATVTVTPGAVSGDSVTFTAGSSFFTSDMVGRQIWKKSYTGVETGRAEIISYSSGTSVTCEILEEFDSTDPMLAGDWYLTAIELSGLDHLEGKEVRICADGGQHQALTVTDGEITLDRQCSVVHVGIGYDGYLETNDLEGGGTNGVAQTKRKSLISVGFRFLNTLYAKYGTDYYDLSQIYFRNSQMKMDRPPEIFTGDRKESFANDIADENDAGWSRSKRAIICQDQPFPCNVQLVVPYLSVSN